MKNITSQINFDNVPGLVGKQPIQMAKDCLKLLCNTRWPLYVTGPSGSGKSIIAFNLAKAYAKKYKVPAYYVQLSPEQTKTSLILGLRLVNGSLEVVNGVVANCMEEGGIIIIDEATHSNQELLLMFNSILDRTSVTAIGDKTIVSHPNFRIIFCANNSSYAGNIKLPQSFAQRLVGMKFDYPEFDDEVEIANKISEDECDLEMDVPIEVTKYLVSLMRETRSDKFPLSVRNISIAMVLCNLAQRTGKGIDDYFTCGNQIESIRRGIANKIFNKKVSEVSEINGPQTTAFVEFISKIGIARFKEIVLQSFMYYLDIDMGFYDLEDAKSVLLNKII